MEFWQIILLYIVQPITWLGVILAVVLYRRRLTQERRLFRIAINRDFYEGRHFIKTALFGLFAGSLLSLGAGMMLTTGAGVLIEILAIAAVLILPVADLSLVVLWLAASLISCLNISGLGQFKFGAYLFSVTGNTLPANTLLLLALFFVIRSFLLHYKKSSWFTPRIREGKRGRRVAYYNWKEFSVVPLVVLIPADLFQSSLSFWPVFSFNGHSFGILIFPLLVAASLKVFKSEMQANLEQYLRQSLLLAALSGAAALGSLFYPNVALLGLALIGLLAVIFYVKRHKRDAAGQRWYVETKEGVRVIAVIPETPAAKMGLQNGDIILECNNEAVKSEAELYAALQKNSAYCHLRVKTFAGDLKITESALYADSPHEIGLILFQ